MRKYTKNIEISCSGYPIFTESNSFHFLSFKPHRPLNLHDFAGISILRSVTQFHCLFILNLRVCFLKDTSLLLAQLLKGRYMIVLMLLPPLLGFANTLPLSFNAAMVKPKKSVMDGTRGPLPVSWKSTCIITMKIANQVVLSCESK